MIVVVGEEGGAAGGSQRSSAPGPPVVDLQLAELYRVEARRLLGMLYVFLGDRGDAEDVVQEAFLRVQRAWGRIEDPARAAPYLRSTAFNLARSLLRRRAVLRRRLLVASVEARRVELERWSLDPTSSALALRDDQRAVLAAVRALPARQRACVVLRYYGDETLEATAATLGISVNSVKTHLRRAAEQLRDHLEPQR